MDRNKLKLALLGATALSFVVAVVLFILGLDIDVGALPCIILIIISLLCLALSAELGYFTYLMVDANPNFFLYSANAKRNMSVEKLTFQVVNARMNRFLAGYAASEGKLWNDRIFDNPYLDMPEEFKPLVAYKMLYGLAEKDSEIGWRCLENSSEETIIFICKGLELNGDANFASAIKGIMAQKPLNMAAIRDYLVRNKRYMQTKMMKYVIANIDRF